MIETVRNELVEDALAGMAEGRVAKIVAERDCFSELFVELQHLRDGPGYLGDLESVRKPGPVVVAGWRKKHLGLVLQPAKRLGVDDPVAVALKRRTDIVFGFLACPPARIGALCGLRRENLTLTRLQVFRDAL